MCNLPGFGGGGATQAEIGQQAQTSALSNTLSANYATNYGEQQDTLKMLNSQIQRIESGQTGPGMGGAELDARRSEIINQTAAQARNVAQQTRDFGAGRVFAAGAQGGGGTDSSGLARANAINKQLTEEAGSSAENLKSSELNKLTAEDYALGRTNAATAAGGLEALSGQYGGAADRALTGGIETGKQSFDEAGVIRQQELEKGSLLGGLVKTGLGVGLDFATGGMTGLEGTGGESFFQKTGDFLKGGIDRLRG